MRLAGRIALVTARSKELAPPLQSRWPMKGQTSRSTGSMTSRRASSLTRRFTVGLGRSARSHEQRVHHTHVAGALADQHGVEITLGEHIAHIGRQFGQLADELRQHGRVGFWD